MPSANEWFPLPSSQRTFTAKLTPMPGALRAGRNFNFFLLLVHAEFPKSAKIERLL